MAPEIPAAMPIGSQGRVRVDRLVPMSAGSQPPSRSPGRLLDQVAGMGADDAAADDAVGRLVEEQLGEALVASVAMAAKPRETLPC
jgi:hypothetical protein